MSEEELNRKMEFIVNQLADITVKQQMTDNIVTRLATMSLERLTSIDESIAMLINSRVEAERRIALFEEQSQQRSTALDEKIAILVDAQIRAEERAAAYETKADERAAIYEKNADERATAADARAAQTDARLDRLASTVEKLAGSRGSD